MTFQFWWYYSFGDISVVLAYKFWWWFSFGDIWFLVTFQCWWYFSRWDLKKRVWFSWNIGHIKNHQWVFLIGVFSASDVLLTNIHFFSWFWTTKYFFQKKNMSHSFSSTCGRTKSSYGLILLSKQWFLVPTTCATKVGESSQH